MTEEIERVHNEKTGKTYIKQRTEKGNIQHRTVGQQGNRFISEDAYNTLKSSSATSEIPTDTRPSRQDRIQDKYPRYDNTTGLDAGRWNDNEPEHINRVRTWMDNAELRQSVKNDPSIKTKQERQKAIEAKARKLTAELKGVQDDSKRKQILRDYDIY